MPRLMVSCFLLGIPEQTGELDGRTTTVHALIGTGNVYTYYFQYRRSLVWERIYVCVFKIIKQRVNGFVIIVKWSKDWGFVQIMF